MSNSQKPPRRPDVTTAELIGGPERLALGLHDYADAKTEVIAAIKARARAAREV